MHRNGVIGIKITVSGDAAVFKSLINIGLVALPVTINDVTKAGKVCQQIGLYLLAIFRRLQAVALFFQQGPHLLHSLTEVWSSQSANEVVGPRVCKRINVAAPPVLRKKRVIDDGLLGISDAQTQQVRQGVFLPLLDASANLLV